MIIVNANSGERKFENDRIITFSYKLTFEFKDGKMKVDSPSSWGFIVYFYNIFGQKEMCELDAPIYKGIEGRKDVIDILNSDINDIIKSMRQKDDW